MMILVIDDSPTICKIYEVALRREGFQVCTFLDGVQAIKWLISPDSQIPTMIFLDINLPKMDGFEVLKRFKKKPALATIPIVIVSGFTDIVQRLKARLAGANSFIEKPFKTQEILEAAKKFSQEQVHAT